MEQNLKHNRNLIFAFLGIFLICTCVEDRSFESYEGVSIVNLNANISYVEVKAMFQEETFQIQDDLIIEGYVTSSDIAGNFFSVLHFQDKPVNAIEGFQIEMDVRDSHLLFPEGSKIYIKLKGLYLGKSNDVFKIGGVFTSFGNVSVGRLPAAIVDQHIFLSEERSEIIPTTVSIENLSENMTNTLVEIEGLEVIKEELEKSFATENRETERTLINCNDNLITLLNSGFSDFQSELLPSGNGTVTGVLKREEEDYFLVIRSLEDIDLYQERCTEIEDEFTSNNLFICELADPDNNLNARFIELYNASISSLPLKGWKLLRYTNENTDVSSTIDLTGFEIQGESAFVISANSDEFEAVYGFLPDMEVGTNSPADSNGDDNLQLVDPFGKVVDVFGRIGEDGSNTDHEFEDGRAVRKVKIVQGNTTYTIDEWRIFNDTGEAGTTNEPQNAPEDFRPGIRN